MLSENLRACWEKKNEPFSDDHHHHKFRDRPHPAGVHVPPESETQLAVAAGTRHPWRMSSIARPKASASSTHTAMITKWNKAAEVIYGYTFKELQGKPAFDLYADRDEMAKMMIPLRRDGFVKNYEITMKRKDGSTFPAVCPSR